MGDYTLGWSELCSFLKTHSLTPHLMHFLTLITMSPSAFTFSKKKVETSASICCKYLIPNVGDQKIQNVKTVTHGVVSDAK